MPQNTIYTERDDFVVLDILHPRVWPRTIVYVRLEMASRKRCVATCSTCKTKLQEIIETGQTDDLYLMSISLLPGVVKIGRSKCPTQRALQLQESSPFWVFPQVVWVNRGTDEKKVHDALRPYRIEDAPSREYFRLPIKSGADLVEQVL